MQRGTDRQGMNKHGLDAIDIHILSAVQEHGLLSKTRLAEIVNLSPSPCLAAGAPPRGRLQRVPKP